MLCQNTPAPKKRTVVQRIVSFSLILLAVTTLHFTPAFGAPDNTEVLVPVRKMPQIKTSIQPSPKTEAVPQSGTVIHKRQPFEIKEGKIPHLKLFVQQPRRIIVRPGKTISKLPPGMAIEAIRQPDIPGTPDCEPPEGNVVKRAILPDGTIELHYANGAKKRRINGGWQILCPDGTEIPSMVLYSTQIPPTLPPFLPDQAVLDWLQYHSNGLLSIISILVNDEEMVNNYLATEQPDMSIYEQIQVRRETIDYLVVE